MLLLKALSRLFLLVGSDESEDERYNTDDSRDAGEWGEHG